MIRLPALTGNMGDVVTVDLGAGEFKTGRIIGVRGAIGSRVSFRN